MNQIEERLLELVALLYPVPFLELDNYAGRHIGYLDPGIKAFDREIQFYRAYFDFMARLTGSGLKFCYPEISNEKELYARESFDMALAGKLIAEQALPVTNDFHLTSPERIIVVSGPNQGGKTTFARTFGQMHYFASLGCPVPAREARLFLCDRLFTHFEREDDIATLRGMLEDSLVRIHDVLDQATSRSIIIINEIFASTTLTDAIHLGTKVIEKIIGLGALCVCVTFIDELAALSDKVVSMVSAVVPENPAQRTFKIERGPANVLAWAISIAEKHHVTYDRLKDRLR